jgi:hypothetical protein
VRVFLFYNPTSEEDIMTTTTALPFDAATFTIRHSKQPWIWEIEAGASVYLANLSNLQCAEIGKSQRRRVLKILRTIEEVQAHNNRLPLRAAQLVLLMALDRQLLVLPVEEMSDVDNALWKTRKGAQIPMSECGGILQNPEKFAETYAKTVVELVAIAQKATVGQVPYRLP